MAVNERDGCSAWLSALAITLGACDDPSSGADQREQSSSPPEASAAVADPTRDPQPPPTHSSTPYRGQPDRPFSFTFAPASDDSYGYRELLLSRRPDKPQALLLRQDQLLLGSLDSATVRVADFDGDGRDEVVLSGGGGADLRYVLIWRAATTSRRFVAQPEQYIVGREAKSLAGDLLVQELMSWTKDGARDRYAVLVYRGRALAQILATSKRVWIEEGIPVFVDANFDGHTDLQLPRLVGRSGADMSAFWLFEPGADRFVYSADLSDLDLPTFDDADREVASFRNRGAAGIDRAEARYRWAGDRLETLRELDQTTTLPKPGGAAAFRTIRARVGGELVTICQAWITDEDEVRDVLLGDAQACQ